MPPSEHDKPGVHVYVLGGTIACGEHRVPVTFDPRRHASPEEAFETVTEPEPGRIKQLIDFGVAAGTKQKCGHIEYEEAQPIVDSAEYTTRHLMQIVKDVRERLARHSMNMLLTCGTDSAAAVMHVLAEGIPSELLGDRRIIVAVSQEHAKIEETTAEGQPVFQPHCEPVDNLNNALFLSTWKSIRGSIGLCCGHVLHAPRGLQKVDAVGKEREVFQGRFPLMAWADDSPVPVWQSDRPMPYQFPRGKDHAYLLEEGVETWPLGTTSHYGNLYRAILGMTECCRMHCDHQEECVLPGHQLRGIVLQAPGTGNLRQNPVDLRALGEAAVIAGKHGVPIVLLSDPMQTDRRKWYEDRRRETVYGGDLSVVRGKIQDAVGEGKKAHIIHGGELAREEARLLVSAAVARARHQHKLEGEDIVRYTEQYLQGYQQFIETGDDDAAAD